MTHAAIPVLRHTIMREYADGDLAVRIVVAAADVADFYAAFPEMNEAAFLACERGAIEVVRDAIQAEYRDGALSVRVRVPPKFKERFRELWPRPNMAAVLAREEPEHGRQAMLDAATQDPPRYGQHARALRTHVRFLFNPKVWAAVGPDSAFLDWLRIQPCARCAWVPHYEMDTFVSCEAAHVRRIADGAGVAIKPPYSAIPLCHRCHAEQHQHGESALGGKEWVDRKRVHYVTEWVWQALKAQLGYEHWNLVPPETLYAWAEQHGLEDCLPPTYVPGGA